MNRGKLSPRPQNALRFGLTFIQQQPVAAVGADQTTAGALIGCVGAPRTAIFVPPYRPVPWLPAVGA